LLSENIKNKIYRITILFVVLYGLETWSVTLRKKLTPGDNPIAVNKYYYYMFIVLENKELRMIITSKRE